MTLQQYSVGGIRCLHAKQNQAIGLAAKTRGYMREFFGTLGKLFVTELSYEFDIFDIIFSNLCNHYVIAQHPSKRQGMNANNDSSKCVYKATVTIHAVTRT